MSKTMPLKQLTQMAILVAMSIVLIYFIRFPIIPAAPFLEYTPGDIPLILGTLLFGPAAGMMISVITAFIQGMTVSAHSGIIGIIMNILSFSSYMLTVGLICRRRKTAKRIIAAMIAGIIATTITMALFNIIFTPIFWGVPREVVIGMILPMIVPFNLIRTGVNSLFAFICLQALNVAIKSKH